MKGWGVVLVILGVGAFILPHFGVQFYVIDVFGQYAPVAAGVAVVLGIVLLVVGFASGQGGGGGPGADGSAG